MLDDGGPNGVRFIGVRLTHVFHDAYVLVQKGVRCGVGVGHLDTMRTIERIILLSPPISSHKKMLALHV